MVPFSVELEINDKLYIRNPQHSPLGKRILWNSILLIDELGIECFTFKKLAAHMGSGEASIYRYFENKHLLLIYLINWYWEWMKFRVDFKTMNIVDPREKLRLAIEAIVNTAKRDMNADFIDEEVLHRIVVTEGVKAYHGKAVDKHNRDGFFLSYKALCQKIADIVLEIDPSFPYPRAMATSLLEMAGNNIYFAEHLPRLTDIHADKDSIFGKVEILLQYFAFNLLDKPNPGNGQTDLEAHPDNFSGNGKKQH